MSQESEGRSMVGDGYGFLYVLMSERYDKIMAAGFNAGGCTLYRPTPPQHLSGRQEVQR